jgi:hypothetical protein
MVMMVGVIKLYESARKPGDSATATSNQQQKMFHTVKPKPEPIG